MNAYVPNVHFELIAIKNLVSNQDYQRNLSPQHIQHTAANFDPYQVNPVKVSRRNGQNFVVNGQHTIEIIAIVSGSRDTPVWCMVYDDLEYRAEADIFANQQKHVKMLKPYEIFMANIEADSDDHLAIRALVESYGLIISPRRMSGSICAVTTLEQIFRKHGYHTLGRVLRLCVVAWEGDPASLSANMLNGVARLVVTYGESLKEDGFRDRVGSVSLREIYRTARERRAGSLGYAETMLLAYNKKRKDGLHLSKLYTGRVHEADGSEEERGRTDAGQ